MRARIPGGLINARIEWHHLQTLATRQTIALRQEDPLEPAGKRGRLAQLRQLLPRDDERFLRGVLREAGVAQHGKRTSERHVLKADHKLAKGFASCLWSVTRISRATNDIVNVFHVY
jgi:hypothetical protein